MGMVICLQTPIIFQIVKEYFFQLLIVHSVSDVKQVNINTAEPLVPGPSHCEIEIAITKLKKYKSPGSD
jgi:hypothetical protein